MNLQTFRICLALMSLLCASAALAQKRQPAQNLVIVGKGQRDWKPTKMTIEQLGKKVDAAMKNLKNTTEKAAVIFEGDEGNGMMIPETFIKSNRVFSIQFPNFDLRGSFPTEVRADGVRFSILGENGWSIPSAIPTAKMPFPSDDILLHQWQKTFPRMMFANILPPKADVWTALTRAIAKGKLGYRAFTEERHLTTRGKKYVSYRIRAERTPEMAKRFGPSTLELVVDGRWFLPVTLRANFKEPKSTRMTKIQRMGVWTFNVKHAASRFKLAKVASR